MTTTTSKSTDSASPSSTDHEESDAAPVEVAMADGPDGSETPGDAANSEGADGEASAFDGDGDGDGLAEDVNQAGSSFDGDARVEMNGEGMPEHAAEEVMPPGVTDAFTAETVTAADSAGASPAEDAPVARLSQGVAGDFPVEEAAGALVGEELAEASLAEDVAEAEPEEDPRVPSDSPISNASLEAIAALVNRRFKLARRRLPKDVRKRTLSTLAALYKLTQTPLDAERWPVTRRKRVEMARTLEELAAEMLGTTAFSPGFYAEGRLAVVRAFDPVRIRGSIQPAKVEAHFVRYEERARRAIARLDWFLERCGVEPEPKDEDEIPPWEKPYGRLDAYKELLWGTPRRKVPQPR